MNASVRKKVANNMSNLYPYQETYLAQLPKGDAVLAAEMGCFAMGTPVLTKNGYRSIETIKEGDLVATFDDYHRINFLPVAKNWYIDNIPKPMISFTYGTSSKTIKATYDHPFFDGKAYYPLYELIWGDLGTSQRVQLQLLCEQYGQTINYGTIRGKWSNSNNETGPRRVWVSTDSDGQKDGESPSSSSTNLDRKPQETTSDKPQELYTRRQSGREFGMGDGSWKCATRLQSGAITSTSVRRELAKVSIQKQIDYRNSRMVGGSYQWDINYRQQDATHVIHRIVGEIPTNTDENTTIYLSTREKISSISIWPAEAYVGLEIQLILTLSMGYQYTIQEKPVWLYMKPPDASHTLRC